MSSGEVSAIRFLQPVDGDILNRHDGTPVEEGLAITVRVDAPAEAQVTVNGTPLSREGEVFTGRLLLRAPETRLCARAEGHGEETITVLWDRHSFPRYRFSVDDNIQFLKDLARNAGRYGSLFDNHYLAFWREMHRRYGARIQFNVYYATDERDFNLTQMPECYRDEWQANADWLRLTFHAYADKPDRPYLGAGYDVLAHDYQLVTREIERFAGPELLSPFTTVHWGEATREGCQALRDQGIRGLAGYFVFENERASVSYYLDAAQVAHLNRRDYWKDTQTDLLFIKHDLVCNTLPLEAIVPHLEQVSANPHEAEVLELMVHEQYFCPFLPHYQPDAGDRVEAAIRWATEHGYRSIFYEEGFLGA
ncbi:MAG: hypothetical protein GX774_13185 [Armatimonadetes bacterium]|nr:hypothetical protein [Armatimonadota bacterium]